MITAAAPSDIWLLLPAVNTPSLVKAGRNLPRLSMVVSARMPSSASMTWVPLRLFTSMGTISFLKVPRSVAAAARCWEYGGYSV